MPKNIIWIVGVVAAVGVVGGGIWAWQAYTGSEAYLADRFIEEWQRRYEEDTIGGETPEETLQLFIAALEEGDVELASKYFVVDEQERWSENLLDIKEGGGTSEMIDDLKRAQKYNNDKNKAVFVAGNDLGQAIVNINIIKIPNGIWKIESL